MQFVCTKDSCLDGERGIVYGGEWVDRERRYCMGLRAVACRVEVFIRYERMKDGGQAQFDNVVNSS